MRHRSGYLNIRQKAEHDELRRSAKVLLAAILAGILAATLVFAADPAQLLPEGSAVPSWAKSGATRTFTADNLWEYINGDAEKYVQAGVRQTLTADYRFQGKIDAVVDIYVMSSAEGARKIFPTDSPAGSQRPKIGDLALLSRGSLTFRKGVYFVRVVAYKETPEISKALLDMGRAIERRMSTPTK